MAGQAPDTLGEVEEAALPDPMAEQVETEAGVTQIHQMGARVRQCDDPGGMLEERRHALVDGVEEATEERRLQIFLDTEIEEDIEWVKPSRDREIRYIAINQPNQSLQIASITAPGASRGRKWPATGMMRLW